MVKAPVFYGRFCSSNGIFDEEGAFYEQKNYDCF